MYIWIVGFVFITLFNSYDNQQVMGNEIQSPATQNWPLWAAMDEFNTVDWQKADWANGGMFNCGWRPDHISFNDGLMTIKLDNTANYGKPYTAGEYGTINTFTYGNFEVHMKAARKSGTVTSFFTYTSPPHWDEIDVEALGKDNTKVQFNYFVNRIGGYERIHKLGFVASLDYHKYRIEWGPGWIN